MKKIFSIFTLLIALFTSQCVFVSCDKDDDYYMGESEDDYKPAEYTMSGDWDLSNVKGLTDAEKQSYKKQLDEKTEPITKVYDTRTDAIKAFDKVVQDFRTVDLDVPGLKLTMYLKRGSGIIKSATLTW